MKESITKFDLEAAFKALDEIEVPEAGNPHCIRVKIPLRPDSFSQDRL